MELEEEEETEQLNGKSILELTTNENMKSFRYDQTCRKQTFDSFSSFSSRLHELVIIKKVSIRDSSWGGKPMKT